ncbi:MULTISPECIES: hypothetical protein [unclassified Pseudoalteromonas]|uniref:hypothetical protein n=1 Tax=unclassified Pseudoalteromonas TaxID=194690 RepID=UPI000CF682B2|nr:MULTISPECIES: hypothetical protein [unclassified Pseudoalteromonas]
MATDNHSSVKKPHVGLSLVQKAPWAVLVILVLLAVVVGVYGPLWPVLAIALIAGLCCGALLLAYWLGKGGTYFIVGLLVPLLAVMFAELPSFTSLYQLILAFFCGFWLSLWAFKLVKGTADNSEAP